MSTEALFSQEPDSAGRDKPDPASGRFVLVAVERGIEHARASAPDALSYLDEREELTPGDRVSVPLGRGSKPTSGVVLKAGGVELLDGFDPARVKPVLERTGPGPSAELLGLAEDLAEFYLCPIGMVLATMTPAAVKKAIGTRRDKLLARVDDAAPDPPLKGVAAEASAQLADLPDDVFPIDGKALASRLGHPDRRRVNALLRAGVLKEVVVDRVHASRPQPTATATDTQEHTLTEEQARVVNGVSESLGSFSPHLLFGVTGSGKTEVYLQIMSRAVASGGTAIMLVPEIALTPQTSARFISRFKDLGVAVLHSGLTSSQRHAEWQRLRSGEARVVVGARSAVFAPVENLKLIVVDEEHDASYKQDQVPRYHARTAAMMRAKRAECPLLLGSATPSLETWAHAKARRITPWVLSNRVGGGALPPIEIVDLDRERRQGMGDTESLGPTLTDALRETLQRGGQALLLLNRRGFSSHAVCSNRSCGWVLHCDHCDAAMVFHKSTNRYGGHVRCHHCGSEQLMPKCCPVDSKPIIQLGSGTQRLEDELSAKCGDLGLIPGDTALRVDRDTMQRAADYFDALERFGSGKARVLFGTQMIAKGLDFPGVELVGIVSADAGLAIPDFRAEERTYQLVSQVAGRAGRGGNPARVLVQTRHPRATSILRAAEHDFVGFADHELTVRENRFPPAIRMARVVVRDRDERKALNRARELADAIRSEATQHQTVDGPASCVISRIADHYRYAIDVYAPSVNAVRAPLQALRSRGLLTSDNLTAIDIDPVSLT